MFTCFSPSLSFSLALPSFLNGDHLLLPGTPFHFACYNGLATSAIFPSLSLSRCNYIDLEMVTGPTNNNLSPNSILSFSLSHSLLPLTHFARISTTKTTALTTTTTFSLFFFPLPLDNDNGRMQLVRGGDSPIGYPHRPPCLRLENRRTSISVDDVIKRTLGSGSSSPDSNLLRVQAQLPGRRHSDNTIHLPRIQVNSSSPPSTGYSRRSSGPAGSSPMPRRHSQGTPGFQGYFAGISNLASGYKVSR